MEFEDILRQVGGYGKYQKQLTILFFIPMTIIFAWISIDTLFMVSVPDHWCYDESVAKSNFSVSEQRVLISPLDDPSCSRFDFNNTEYLYQNLTSNGTKVVSCSSGWQYDKRYYDSTAATKWDLVCDQRYYPSLILTLEGLGSILFTPFYGYAADRYGRKRLYLIIAAISSVTELASVLIDDFITFVVLRTIHSGIMPTMFTLAFLLIIEIVDPEKRGHINGIYNFFWTAGFCLLPLVVYISRSWINLGLVCSIACAFNLLYYKYIPESPSWLVSRERYEEATTIMERIGKKNGKRQDRTHLLTQLQNLVHDIQKKKHMEDSSSSYLLFKSPTMRKRFFILAFCWISFFTTYYGLLYNLRNLTGNEFINFFLLSVVEVPGNILFWILMDQVGRRWTSSMGFIAVGFICLGPLTGFIYSDIIFSMIGKLVSTGNFMVLDQQGTELFPTGARSFGINTVKTLANALTIVIPFLADLGEYRSELPFIVMAGISFVAGILAAFLPETLNENLPQTISDAEEIGKNQKFFSWIRRKGSVISDESLHPEQWIKSSEGTNGEKIYTEEEVHLRNIVT